MHNFDKIAPETNKKNYVRTAACMCVSEREGGDDPGNIPHQNRSTFLHFYEKWNFPRNSCLEC